MKEMHEAIAASKWGMENDKGGPFGAAVYRDGNLIASACNTVTSTNDPTAHAEVNAIQAASATLGTYDLSDCILYTSCEPCPMCFGAIYWARFKEVHYANTREDAAFIGFDDEFIYEQLKVPMREQKIPFIHEGMIEAFEVFEQWLDKEDKKEY